jgi:hypothetical protein
MWDVATATIIAHAFFLGPSCKAASCFWPAVVFGDSFSESIGTSVVIIVQKTVGDFIETGIL